MAPVELHIRIDNTYIPVLSIPVDDCNRFALNPLRWLRFLGYAIYGSQGHISTTADGPPVDYESAVEGGAHYYFTSAGTIIHSCWAVELCLSSKQWRLGCWTFAVLITEPLTPKLLKVTQDFVLIYNVVMGVALLQMHPPYFV
jgi:hypothetical protein